jgi:hypothetical protein
MFGISAFSKSPFSTISASGIASANIVCSAQVVVTTTVNLFDNIASITANAVVSAIGKMIRNGSASINAIATVTAKVNNIYAAKASINEITTITAKAYKQGEEWTTVTEGSNTWLRQG